VRVARDEAGPSDERGGIHGKLQSSPTIVAVETTRTRVQKRRPRGTATARGPDERDIDWRRGSFSENDNKGLDLSGEGGQ